MAGESETFTKEQVDALIAERLASEVEGLKRNQSEALKEAKAAREKLKAYEGVDAEEFKRLKQASEEAEKTNLEAKGQWQALQSQMTKKMDDLAKVHAAEVARYRSTVEQHLIDAEATRELAAHSDSPGLLLPHVKARMQVIEQDGRFVARVVDAQGNVRIGNGSGAAPMTLAELMEEMKQDKTFAPAFRGTGSTGGGATKSTGGASGSGPNRISRADLFKGDNLERVAKGNVDYVNND